MKTSKTRNYAVAMWADGEKFFQGSVRATNTNEALELAEKWAKTANDLAREADPPLPLIGLVKVGNQNRVIH